MPSLVDTNVWFPILRERHEHHRAAWDWWESRQPGEAVWCRVAQLGVLRLLTNPVVMGDELLEPEAAWSTWHRLAHDERCSFLAAEPGGVDALAGACVSGRSPTPKLWADAYLAALAESAGLEMTTFDRGFRRFPVLTRLNLLAPPKKNAP